LEVIGFGLIVFQLVRVQRQEFGTPQFVVRSREWGKRKIRRLLRRPQQIHAVSATMTGTADVAGSLSVRKGMGPQASDRFAAIEFNLEQIENELRASIGLLDKRLGTVGDELTATRNAIQQGKREQEEARKAELRSSLAFEAWGVGFFLFGTVLSVLGSL
jgi:hypothetical protein